MEVFRHFRKPSAYQTLQNQNKLKNQYVLFWSYYGSGHLDQNRTIRGRPRGIMCRLAKTGYYLELLNSQIMKLLGSTRSKLTKNENGEDVPNLEISQ